ncbi:hypothetical protein M0812_30191 [Anaeramoeba flamelloides]|uniref:Uncharacterized protein n=1 Tax=Anaeramoeba flamelloides TaxID=1746091 RepID=A0AAV7Y1C2_9EUKA|nr:hypothetical protein M0812_30191 [Anaeramoeba flamelloides]
MDHYQNIKTEFLERKKSPKWIKKPFQFSINPQKNKKKQTRVTNPRKRNYSSNWNSNNGSHKIKRTLMMTDQANIAKKKSKIIKGDPFLSLFLKKNKNPKTTFMAPKKHLRRKPNIVKKSHNKNGNKTFFEFDNSVTDNDNDNMNRNLKRNSAINSLTCLFNQVLTINDFSELPKVDNEIKMSGDYKMSRASPFILSKDYLTLFKKKSLTTQGLKLIMSELLQDLNLYLSNRSIQLLKKCNHKKPIELNSTLKFNNNFQNLNLKDNIVDNHKNNNGDIHNKKQSTSQKKRFTNLELQIRNSNKKIVTLIFASFDNDCNLDKNFCVGKHTQKNNWIFEKENKLFLSFPLLFIKEHSKKMLKHTGVLEWLARRFDCFTSRMKFDSYQMGTLLSNWLASKNDIITKTKNDQKKLNNIFSKSLPPKTTTKTKIKQSLFTTPTSRLAPDCTHLDDPIKLLYSKPFRENQDITLSVKQCSIWKIIQSGITGKDSQNLIQCIHDNFSTLYKLNLDNCLLNQINFPNFIIKTNGMIVFEKNHVPILFLENLLKM